MVLLIEIPMPLIFPLKVFSVVNFLRRFTPFYKYITKKIKIDICSLLSLTFCVFCLDVLLDIVRKVAENISVPAILLTSIRLVTNLFKSSCYLHWLQRHLGEVKKWELAKLSYRKISSYLHSHDYPISLYKEFFNFWYCRFLILSLVVFRLQISMYS